MKPLLPAAVFLFLFVFLLPVPAQCQPQSAIIRASLLSGDGTEGMEDFLPDDPNIPSRMLDLMRASHKLYLEGSRLIQGGESAKARAAFDGAVDLILLSGWELSSTPALGAFFQDLITRIQREESQYLRAEIHPVDSQEPAVFDTLNEIDLIPIEVDPELVDAVEADILNSKYDIPIRVNERVLKSLNYWIGTGRKIFTAGISRSGLYRDMIERIFKEENVPQDLMYLAQVESLYKPNALSRALAKGIWQFARGTAIRYGLRVDRYVDERSDPEKSTRAAARYLKDLYAMFNDWNLVLAAYNWGEGKIQSLINRSGVADFWQLADLRRKLPAETRNHVPLVIASVILAHNLDKYGFQTDMEESLRFDQVALDRQLNLKAAAKALDVPLETLKTLNPALRTSYTPSNYPEFVLNVPEGMGESFIEKLAALPADALRMDPAFNGLHEVQPGETLSSIALLYGTTVEDLQASNDVPSPRRLRAGATLSVPENARSARASLSPADLNGRHYVRPGETLSSISMRYGVSVAALQSENNIPSPRLLIAGDWIKIPASSSAAEDDSGMAGGRMHQVRSGETLSSIAARYGVSVESLQKTNAIRSPRTLQIGTWLLIPAENGAVEEKTTGQRKG